MTVRTPLRGEARVGPGAQHVELVPVVLPELRGVRVAVRGFGLAHPAFYTLIYGEPRPGVESPAQREAAAVLAGMVRRIAEAGRLRVGEERAAHLVHGLLGEWLDRVVADR
jgi:hypothetical protein